MCEQRKPHRVVWLASYLDGALRQRHGENRYYRRLPAVEFFRNRLVEVAGPGADSAGLRQLGGGYDVARDRMRPTPMLRCLLHVSATGALHQESVLTPWDAECNLLRWYFGWPSDAYSVTVGDVKTCVVGQPFAAEAVHPQWYAFHDSLKFVTSFVVCSSGFGARDPVRRLQCWLAMAPWRG